VTLDGHGDTLALAPETGRVGQLRRPRAGWTPGGRRADMVAPHLLRSCCAHAVGGCEPQCILVASGMLCRSTCCRKGLGRVHTDSTAIACRDSERERESLSRLGGLWAFGPTRTCLSIEYYRRPDFDGRIDFPSEQCPVRHLARSSAGVNSLLALCCPRRLLFQCPLWLVIGVVFF
jgi:hypothetical protein